MPRKNDYDRNGVLTQLKYRLRELAERFRDEHPDLIEEGEMLYVDAWIEKAENNSNAVLYPLPETLEITRGRSFTLLHPAMITHGELRVFEHALKKDKTISAYVYLKTLLLEFGNQPTHFERLLRKAFGLSEIGGLPSFLKNPEDTIRYFRDFFMRVDHPELMLVISNRYMQLWEVKR